MISILVSSAPTRSHRRRALFLLTSTLAFIVLGSGCGPREPSGPVVQRQEWVTRADRDVMAYACPELQREPLEAEDPLQAATDFVYRGRDLMGWATEPIDAVNPTPRSLAPSLDSLQASIGLMVRSFSPAIATAESHHRECNGQFALNCDRRIRARDVIDSPLQRELDLPLSSVRDYATRLLRA